MEKLTWFQMKLLVQWFAHYMTQDQRRKLMCELPAAYNAMCDFEHVEVIITHTDGTKEKL